MSCHQVSKKVISESSGIISDSLREEKIYDTLFKIPEVQIIQKRIDSITNHKHRISFIPDTLLNHTYIIRAGYNSELRFENYFTFYVDSSTFAIKIYNVDVDSAVSLNEYRKTNK